MAASAVLFALMAVALRFATAQVSAFEAGFFRSLFGLIFALPLLIKPGLGMLRTRSFGLYLVRGTTGTLSMLASFWALAHLPLAQAISISYSTPLFVTVGAVLILGEVVRARRWSAVVVGFVGVLIIMRPGGMADSNQYVSFDMLIALAGAAFAAMSYIAIKYLSRTESPDAVVIYMSAIMTVMSLVPALLHWTWPDAAGWFWLVLTGLLATIAQVCMTRAYQAGEVSALIPINFIQLPVVVACAWFAFGQTIDTATVIGAVIIIGANVYIARREAMLARRTVTDPEIAPSESGQSA
ncbi:DMT family transporter [Rudaea sp.]|uniref:DMT family transporter n=1 Tax=Rudaea sp. TaxID=2136325 RepID=UPI002ED071D6